jgi:hypothetical protein
MTQTEIPRVEQELNLRVGDLVQVRSAEEIMATLDEKGELDNLPFMPEMLAFCGQRLTVHKVAHKLCDTISASGLRRMERAVHLTGARCDGSAHGGCQTACSLYWKEAWLKRVDDKSPPVPVAEPDGLRIHLPILEVNTRREPDEDGAERFRCQATELLRAAPTCLPFREPRQYVQDVRSGNAGVLATLQTIFLGLFNHLQDFAKRFLPSWLLIKGGQHWGFVAGRLTGKTPTGELNLQPGELVRIKSKEQIVATINQQRLNRGLGFEEEMARYCGRTARVRARVDRCIDEKTGRMLHMKAPCIVLDSVICDGVYSGNCPREFVPFWREIWLERVEAA